ncbi:MAG: glycoside hydrolase family protein [Alphaproteobacteria bacterium]|nr:glycoside hydrolase family protein [Alphaproteobacteria bacterium]
MVSFIMRYARQAGYVIQPITGKGVSTMDRERLAEELKSDEGIVPHAYQDHLGYWTIGCGRLIDRRKGGGLSEDEIMYLLGNDIAKVHQQVRSALPWFDGLTDTRKRALCNMAFQMGINGLLGFKNTLALIQAGKYAEAADNALKSKWAQQTPARAKRVADMIRKG